MTGVRLHKAKISSDYKLQDGNLKFKSMGFFTPTEHKKICVNQIIYVRQCDYKNYPRLSEISVILILYSGAGSSSYEFYLRLQITRKYEIFHANTT